MQRRSTTDLTCGWCPECGNNVAMVYLAAGAYGMAAVAPTAASLAKSSDGMAASATTARGSGRVMREKRKLN